MTPTARPLLSPRVAGLLGFLAVLGLWELFCVTIEAHSIEWPPPHQIAITLYRDGWHTYWPHIKPTVWEASRGFLYGNALAIALAILALALPVIEKPLLQLGAVTYCLPAVAIASILSVVFSGSTPKVIISAMFVFFTTLVGTLVGLRSAHTTNLDLIHVFGGGTFDQIRKVRIRACLPNLFASLQIAAPAAMLGAIIGEYVGHQDYGLGIFMTASQSDLQVARTWGIALVTAALSGTAYIAIGLIARPFISWTRVAR